MRQLYNIRIKKPITTEDLEKEGIHYTWATVINNSELYATKPINGGRSVEILFKRKKSICTFNFSIEYAREHFEIVGRAVNDEGREISHFINRETDYN